MCNLFYMDFLILFIFEIPLKLASLKIQNRFSKKIEKINYFLFAFVIIDLELNL